MTSLVKLAVRSCIDLSRVISIKLFLCLLIVILFKYYKIYIISYVRSNTDVV